MKKLIITLTIAVLALTATATPTSAATSNKALVKKYCMENYHMAPKYVKYRSKRILKRKGQMIVEVVKTKSFGKYGRTPDGCKIRYIKRVKKGKTVKCYLIYNPKNNAHDDVVALVCTGKIRGDKVRKATKKATKKTTTAPAKTTSCEYCHGETDKCAYWYTGNTGEREHMTPEEIKQFEQSEKDR